MGKSIFKYTGLVAAVLAGFILAAAPNALALDPSTAVFSDGSVVAYGEAAGALKAYAGTGKLSVEALLAQDGLGPSADEIKALQPVGGGSAIESMLGMDTRSRTYTTYYPARATALVTFTGGYCTGFFINSTTVATAGHCVHTGGGGAWRTSVRVYPGYNAGVAPYGSFPAKWLASVTGWTVSGSEAYDYGVIKLSTAIGSTTGWYGMTTANGAGFPTIIIGYPGDKSPVKSQWTSSDRVWTTTTNQLFYYNDTAGGMSGSAVWYDRRTSTSNGPYVIAIHAYGVHGGSPHSVYNHGTRIISSVLTNYSNWAAAP